MRVPHVLFLTCRNRGHAQLVSLIHNVERSLLRLAGEVRKNEAWLRREVEELERETAPGAVLKPGRTAMKVKTEKLEKQKALRQAQQDVSLLVNVVRLADYICCESQVALMQYTLENLRDACESRAFLLTQVQFTEAGLEFVAGEDEVRQTITVDLVDGLSEMVRALPRLPQQESLRPMFGDGPVVKVGPEVATMLMGYKPLQKARCAT